MAARCNEPAAGSRRAAVLLLALAFGFCPMRATGAEESDPVVATVNGHDIRQSDVFASIESFPLDQQLNMRKRIDLVVQSLVNEELLFQYALAASDPWTRQLRRQIKSAAVGRIIEGHVRARIQISDEHIRDYYQRHRDTLRGWHVRARHIRLREREACEALMGEVDSEETFARLADAHSLDRLTAGKGGDLGYMMYSPNSPGALGFELAFFDMQLDEMRIFESAEGCHLVRVVEIDDPEDPPFETIREFLRPKLEAQEERRRLEALLEALSGNASIDLTPANSPMN